MKSAITITLCVGLVLVGLIVYFYVTRQPNNVTPTPSPSAVPTQSAVPSPSPSVSPTSTPAPSPAATPTVPSNPNISVDAPAAMTVVHSPLTITGKARGSWFFEAQFPVILVDSTNHEIAHGTAQATSDWMTTDFVPFTATLTFSTPETNNGHLILHNDNPSGLPANDQSVTIPVLFR